MDTGRDTSGSPATSGTRWREWLPEIAFLLVTTGAGLWAAGRWVDPCSDAAYSWSLAYRLSQGERLYSDIFLPYAPLFPRLLGAAARLFGASARFYLWVNWIPAVLAGLLLVRCGRLFLTTLERLALVGVVLATSLFVPGPGRLVFPYNSAVGYALALAIGAFLLVLPDGRRLETRALLAGCLAGLAFDCKQEIGVAALLGLGAAVFAGIHRPFAWVTRLFAGFLAAFLPAAVYVLSSAPIESLRHDSHVWPLAAPPTTTIFLMRLAAGLHRPDWFRAIRMTIWVDLARVSILALASLLLARERRRSVWLRVAGLIAALGLWRLLEGRGQPRPLPSLSLSMTVAFLVALLALLSRSLPGRPFLFAFGLFAGVVGMRTAVASNFASHYAGPGHLASALTSVLFLVLFVPRLLFGKARSASFLRSLTTFLLLAAAGWQTARGIQSLRFPSHVKLDSPAGQVFIDPAYAGILNAVARESAPRERVLVLPETYAVDVLFGLRNLSPLIQALPGWLDEDLESRLIGRMEQSPPDLVVLFERPYRAFGSEPFGVGYGRLLSDWCFANYRVVESFPAGKILRKTRDGFSPAARDALRR